MDFTLILLEQYRRTCFGSAPNTTTEFSVFATVDSVTPSSQTMSSVNEISSRTDVERSRGNLASHISASERGAEVGVVASSMVSVPYLLLSVALRQTFSVTLALEKTPSNSMSRSPCR